MSEVTLSLKFEGDSDGYVTFECPFCESEFKLQAAEFQDEDNSFPELFCPYCGLPSEVNTFYSSEVVEQAKILATNYMYEQLNQAFGKMSRKLNRSNIIKMKFKPLKKINVKELKDKDTAEEIFECSACNNHLKVLYCAGVSKVFCPYCGVDQ
ncbi:hypothetical protein [Sporomusa aerivorans]|uniref:hypothetical protein n=1 Tax=Sporomusa aerivorans TaxID=204936 RepID=UPI00352A4EB3